MMPNKINELSYKRILSNSADSPRKWNRKFNTLYFVIAVEYSIAMGIMILIG